MQTMRDAQRQQRLRHYREEIPLLEARRELAIARDEKAAYIRLLERKIAHRQQRLANGWPDDERPDPK